MTLHLSAPVGQSKNDYILTEELSLCYSSIDNATRMLSALGKGSLMGKIDLKSAFKLVPVRRFGITWNEMERSVFCGHLSPLWIKVYTLPFQSVGRSPAMDLTTQL